MHLLRVGVLSLALSSFPAHAIEPFVIKDIRVEGIQRTEAGTVFSYLPVKVGDTMTDERASQTLRALFATGFFRDVTIEADDGVLVVVVQERPSIAQIGFTGLREFDKDTILKAMSQVGIAEGRIFDKGLLDRAEQELKRQYLTRGRYAANVSTTVTPLERNRVALNFTVEEGEAAKIRQITIIGNETFSERELRRQMFLRTPGMLTWYSKADQYSRQKLSADLETLRSYYLDRGHLEFNVESTQVSITPDKKDIYITISLTEGPKYTVSDVKVGGELLLPEAEIRKLITLKPGDVFSRARVAESTKRISDRLGNEGYAFANVNATPELDKQNRQAAFTFFVDPGRRVYVRRINVAGNSRTRDEVIRRELRQFEGGWFSSERLAMSRSRIDKLGYFTDVNIETPPVQGTTDQVDVNVTVTEKPTGAVLLGAGFGSGEGLILSGSVTQQNIFGSGKHVSVGLNTSKLNTTYALSYTDPYYTVDGLSRGFDLYLREVDASRAGLGNYSTRTAGGAVRFGVPVTDIDTINYGIGYERTSIATFADSPLVYLDYVNTFGSRTDAVVASAGWLRDGRDSLIYPTKGTLQRASVEVAVPGPSLNYYKGQYQYQRYFPLTRDYTLMLNGEIGYGAGYGDTPTLPFFKNFYVGGVNSLRGFRTFTVGPTDSQGFARGGSKKVLGNAEFLFPFPGLTGDKTVRMSAFVDSGMAGEKYDFADVRFAFGMGVLWVSPMGPLKISVAVPLREQPADRKQIFQFTFGGAF
ncbi:MAG TPA: outer membrane protein assembly factor BamA [Burkholderiales bacterium]|nr:outer membrane protein assembly factor BamA [Burkholderiales bacterium]